MGTCTSRSPGLSGRACIITNCAKGSANGNAARGDDGNCIWYACSQGEPRHAHGGGRRARTSTLASGRFVPVLDAQVPGRHDEAVLARRPSATPVVRHFASICRVLRYLKQFLASSRARPTRRRPLTTSTHQGAAAEGEDRRRHARQ